MTRTPASPHPVLAPALLEQVLERFGFSEPPPVTLDGLRAVYGAWSQRVPFDNVRKLIHLRSGESGPLPGSDPSDFFAAWLCHGTGSTCWGGHGALHTLLAQLGFRALRGYGTMMLGPDIPPNHGTVVVDLEQGRFLVDASILHGEPLALLPSAESRIEHPSWGATATPSDGLHRIRFRPVHMPQGLDCRVDRIDVPASVFHDFHEASRSWSPFNYALYVRANRGASVVGAGFGQQYRFDPDGATHQAALAPAERLRFLVEQVGISEELAAQLPADIETPPPPPNVKGRAA